MRFQASDDQGYQQADREPMGNCREVVFELLQSGAVFTSEKGKVFQLFPEYLTN